MLLVLRHTTVQLDNGGSLDLAGSRVLWTPKRRKRRRRAIVFGIACGVFLVGALSDLIRGHPSPTGSLVVAAIAGLLALHQTYGVLRTYLAPNEPEAWELLIRAPHGRLVVKQVVDAGPPENEILRKMNYRNNTRISWCEVSPADAQSWLEQFSRSAASKLFAESTTAATQR